MRWLRLLADCLFPARCEACDAPLAPGHPSCLCTACRLAMSPPPPPLCPLCGVPVPPAAATPCGSCRDHPPAFTRAHAAGLYLPAPDGLNPLATAVRRLKYGRRRALADPLGALLAERYPFGPEALLVPVPLHRRRLRERGFNQAVLLAKALARRRGLEVAPRALARTRATRGQPGLDAAARRRNLAHAFTVPRPALVAGRDVVLVDDVLTTGATADACARALRAAEARRVDVYTVGRAP